MQNPRLAGRYAKSIIDLAGEKDQLDVVYQDMLYLQGVCKSSREFVSLLKSPVISGDKKQQVLDAITKDKVSALTASFNKLMIKKRKGGKPAGDRECLYRYVQWYKRNS